MTDFYELANRYKRVENPVLDSFKASLKRQIEAFNNGTFNTRSWVKQDGTGYTVTLGKLPDSYELFDKEQVVEFLLSALTAAQTNADFQADVAKAYGEPVVEPKKRGRRKAA
ncbi:hypothetical protein [Neorhizobium sp. NCHU2750]|uniref:hypothetical protein n=1 Tax=Neorhizobium sp. NCHU2750 TaxID=1825976 RepID=UPI000E7089F4|nr:hypothetical protein NCHU2750_15380 [Neorhizobium sp. NCHU2750]